MSGIPSAQGRSQGSAAKRQPAGLAQGCPDPTSTCRVGHLTSGLLDMGSWDLMGRKKEKKKTNPMPKLCCFDGKKPNVPLHPDLHCVGKEGATEKT